MRTNLHRSLMLAASALALGFAAPAYAQDSAEGASDTGDIIVTARRVEEKLQDVPISITVYSQEQISSRNIVNSADLAVYTPSLSVNSRYGPEKASFAIRGFVQDFQTAPSVGVYFADVVGPRNSSTTTAGNGVGVGHLFDLQNVQVLKGPQGTLFGRNTTGGAVLLVPNKPTDKLEGYVEASAGSYDMMRAQAVLNVPLSESFKIRIGVDRMKRDGFLRNRSGVGPDRMANSNYFAGRVSILADLSPTFENHTIATYADSDNSGTTFRVVGCVAADKITPRTLQGLGFQFGCAQLARQNARGDSLWDVENSHPNPRVHMKTWQVINTTTWQASDNLTVKNIFSYAHQFEDTNLNLGGDNFLLPNGSLFAPIIQIDTTPGYHYGAESTMTEELQVQGKSSNGKFIWQAGGYLEVANPIGFSSQSVPFIMNCTDYSTYKCSPGVATINLPTGPVRTSNLGQPFYQQRWRSKGIYAQGTYNLSDQFAVTGGIRYTWDSQRHYQSSVTYWFDTPNTPIGFCSNARISGPGGIGTLKFITPGDFRQCDIEFSKSSSAPTWSIDLQYKPLDDIMVFAKYSRGYRAGGVNTPFVFFETWEPEKVDSYEIGAKTSFRGAVSGYFNISAFYNQLTNQQLQATLTQKPGAPTTGGTGTVNAGKSRIWGFEVDAAAKLFDGLKLDVGYTYLNTRLVKLVGLPADDFSTWTPGTTPWARVNPTAAVGQPLTLSPKHRLQLTGTYTLPLDDSIGDVSFGATFVHTASQIANSASPFGILPKTNLLNLNASWNKMLGQPIDLAFFMTNVGNKAYAVNVGNFFNTFGYESVPVNEPRMWGFRLKYRFGD